MTVSTGMRATFVKTLTSAPVKISVIRKPIARTLKGTTLAAARMDTLGKGFTVSAVNVRTISALITKSACRRQLKSVNAEKVST